MYSSGWGAIKGGALPEACKLSLARLFDIYHVISKATMQEGVGESGSRGVGESGSRGVNGQNVEAHRRIDISNLILDSPTPRLPDSPTQICCTR
jgi:hypothetical protein